MKYQITEKVENLFLVSSDLNLKCPLKYWGLCFIVLETNF